MWLLEEDGAVGKFIRDCTCLQRESNAHLITQRGAAKALCEQNDVEVTLIDALPDPTGVSSYTIMQLLEHCNHRYVG